MTDPIALIPTRLDTTFLGLRSLVASPLLQRCVLAHTVARVARVRPLGKIVLVHDADRDPMSLLDGLEFGVPVCGFGSPKGLVDPHQGKHAAARKWSLAGWRGGLGGATCYDELLPAGPLLAAMVHHSAESALLVGADWPLVDSDYCQRVLSLHLAHREDMQMTFTQAPPGLSGVAVGRQLVEQMEKNHVCFGQVIAYNPAKPQADPIGRDLCVQIPATVRSCVRRFICDTPASAKLINAIAVRLGPSLDQACAEAVCEAADALTDDRTDNGFAGLPQSVTLELTPRRLVTGPLTVQSSLKIDRPDMALETAVKIVGQMGVDQDTVLTLGGLGDALLHPHWSDVVTAAHAAGVLGIAVETDLLVDEDTMEKLLTLPVDVISVRINADTAKLYKKVMDPDDQLDDGFGKVIRNLQWLFNRRTVLTDQRLAEIRGVVGLPWFVLCMVKTPDTLCDMETFFDRWLTYGAQPVIEPATSGCGLIGEQSPVRMDPPGRFACRQLSRRMTIHADGRVALCDQDWLNQAGPGDATVTPLVELWRSMQPLRQAHALGQWEGLKLCGRCHEWHRP